MEDHKETVEIFSGAGLIAKGLVARLEKFDIVPIIKDDHQSAIMGGFGSAIPNYVRMYIREEELAIAKDAIEGYLKEVE